MKKILLSLLLLTLFACNKTPDVSSEGPITPSVPAPSLPVSADPATVATLPLKIEDVYTVTKPIVYDEARGEFTVNIVAKNYNAEQTAKLVKAQALIKKVFNSLEYKEKVLRAQFTSNKGMASEKIYNHLMGGAEALKPDANYQMDLTVENYYKSNRVVGYTYAGVMIVYTNTKFHSSYKPCNVASNLTHEWTHKMGFGHSSASDSKSVPYTHNDIIEELCPLAELGQLTAIKPILLPQAVPQQ